jgi:hypothetical protein
VEGSCEHGNEPSGSIKCRKSLECLNNWLLLNKGSAPLNYMLYTRGSVGFACSLSNCNIQHDQNTK